MLTEEIELGNQILYTLSQQQKQLYRTELNRLEIEYQMKLAERMKRGMTWKGWFMNLITKQPIQPSPKESITIHPPVHTNNEIDQLLNISKTMGEYIAETNRQISVLNK